MPFSEDTAKFIAAALSPARVTDVALDIAEKRATVSVPEDQQSLAIGKAGQNARLANKLTDWKIDIKGAEGFFDNENGDFVSESLEPATGIWDSLIRQVKETSKSGEPDVEEVESAVESVAVTADEKETEESIEEKTTDTEK